MPKAFLAAECADDFGVGVEVKSIDWATTLGRKQGIASDFR